MTALRLAAAGLGLMLAASPSLHGQGELRTTLARIDAYLADYEQRMSAVVADEHYVQKYDHVVVEPHRTVTTRTLDSDFAFWTVARDTAWMGFRDTYVVDDKVVRDRDDRLQRILGGSGPEALRQAYQVAESNSRYNIGEAPRTINVPTLALGMIHPKNRWRFRTRAAGRESIDGRELSKVEFREFQRPTIIRTREDAAQPARIVAWVDPVSGAIHRTVLDIDASRMSPITTKITVSYGTDAALGFLVPREMAESYAKGNDRAGWSYLITATATYTNYRSFQTSGRVVP